MLDFKAKMHQIRFPLGLRSPRLMAIFMGPTSKGREWEGEGKGWKWKGWERGGKGRGEEEREEGKRREGGKRRGSSHAFCFSNLGSSVNITVHTGVQLNPVQRELASEDDRVADESCRYQAVQSR